MVVDRGAKARNKSPGSAPPRTPCGASRNGVAPCGVIHQSGLGKRSATQELLGRILAPTSCLVAMK